MFTAISFGCILRRTGIEGCSDGLLLSLLVFGNPLRYPYSTLTKMRLHSFAKLLVGYVSGFEGLGTLKRIQWPDRNRSPQPYVL
jgi:hypothetical protein